MRILWSLYLTDGFCTGWANGNPSFYNFVPQKKDRSTKKFELMAMGTIVSSVMTDSLWIHIHKKPGAIYHLQRFEEKSNCLIESKLEERYKWWKYDWNRITILTSRGMSPESAFQAMMRFYKANPMQPAGWLNSGLPCKEHSQDLLCRNCQNMLDLPLQPVKHCWSQLNSWYSNDKLSLNYEMVESDLWSRYQIEICNLLELKTKSSHGQNMAW